VRHLDGAAVRLALAYHETPLIEPEQHFLLFLVKAVPCRNTADCGTLIVDLGKRRHESRRPEIDPVLARRTGRVATSSAGERPRSARSAASSMSPRTPPTLS
jgi:hypothetical protein